MEITDDKWNEIDGNVISVLHLALADGVLSSVAEKPLETNGSTRLSVMAMTK